MKPMATLNRMRRRHSHQAPKPAPHQRRHRRDLTRISVPFEIRMDADGSGKFSGYGSTWEVDGHRTRMMPGCFTRWLNELKARGDVLVVLSMHDPEEPIGTIPASAIHVDGEGLRFDGGQLLVGGNVPEADRIRDLAQAGALKGLSLGFEVRKSEPSKHPGCVRDFLDVEVWEVSFVVWPSNRGAKITSIRAEGEARSSFYEQAKISGMHDALVRAIYCQTWHDIVGASTDPEHLVSLEIALEQFKADVLDLANASSVGEVYRDASPSMLERGMPDFVRDTRSVRSGGAAPIEDRAGARLSSSTRDGLEDAQRSAVRCAETIQMVLVNERAEDPAAETRQDPPADPLKPDDGAALLSLRGLVDHMGAFAATLPPVSTGQAK